MNDSEIIKALEQCTITKDKFCVSCPLAKEENCTLKMINQALDLIHRQQAEIESLKNANGLFEYLNYAAHHYVINDKTYVQDFETIEAKNKAIHDEVVLLSDIQTAKSEVVREFAEKLKKFAVTERVSINQRRHVDVSYVRVYDIDRLVEEMGCNDG